ncbi:hypothetical protein D3C73_1622310 [compost metagenome]
MEDFDTARLGQPLAAVAEQIVSNTQCLLDIGLGGNGHMTNDCAAVGRVDSQGLFRHKIYLKWQ